MIAHVENAYIPSKEQSTHTPNKSIRDLVYSVLRRENEVLTRSDKWAETNVEIRRLVTEMLQSDMSEKWNHKNILLTNASSSQCIGAQLIYLSNMARGIWSSPRTCLATVDISGVATRE